MLKLNNEELGLISKSLKDLGLSYLLRANTTEEKIWAIKQHDKVQALVKKVEEVV